MIYVFCRGLLRLIFAVLYRLESIGKDNVPDNGGVLLCANHISMMDPITVGIKLKRQVKYMAKAELFEIPVFGPLLHQLGAFPVKRGGFSRDSIRMAIKILQQGEMMGIFPEGTRNSTSGTAKKGAASFALRSKATVIPVAILGEYKLFRKMKVVYGVPVDLSEFMDETASGDQLEAVTEVIMSRIHEMQKTGQPTTH
ncbi:lysophospholipid acyltransferase family protein [Paenibacillus crassostreae]|uniref:Acyl-phosphate glycerol 3-phosphate acyltransferase n=1 Tax=Paenibacillus crassostreae TaxID=1763538 RepID=A0A167DJI6_9BACL|nr:lysophospholipid acyltransferase family protein [Paenibacillus crassostreae]AOZ91387.1 1-acyl-sn-glycerol-3-phosphate acyltransferase [Paenibacillus crassostreae]OAB74454.1 acyl-phosphate glycerol 3-phosphate acyltransferase [Paenibacillus crassostreae]